MPGPSNKKQSQRTKGNLKPSSSSHAAQQLVSGGSTPSGFIGFGQSPKYVPASSTLDDMDSSLDSDFRMVLRKLTKRDATTKIKGLQEFSEMCKEKKEEDLKAVLPFWPRTYNKMVMDTDYRVREAAQQAMSTLVYRVRRNLAPYLKSLMGGWLLSQCDTYPTVASAAQAAFVNTFPPAKQTEAIMFCKESILEYFTENLVTHTAQSLSDTKTTDHDDMENKYNRVLTASLLAIRKLLTCMPANQIDSLKQPLTDLLEHAKFWKHGKSKIASVKGAMYSCLAGLCQSQPELSALYVSKMAPLVLHNLDEKEAGICTQLWEAVLSVVNYIPDCWKHVNVQKGFWPKLKVVLETGCHGNAVVIGPNILPLISRIPPDLFPDNNKFNEDFFTSFKLGLNTPTVQKSPSECSAVIKAYMECAQYIIRQNAATQIVDHILSDQVLPVIEASLIEKASPFCKSPLYGMMGNMLTGLEFTDHPAARQTASTFWSQLKETADQKLTAEESGDDTTYEERIVHLVRCLFYPQTEIKQKSVKVKFESPGKENGLETADLGDLKINTEPATKVEIGASAKKFVQDLTLITFELAHKHFSTTHLKVFSQLLELDSSEDTVAKVIACCHGDVATETTSHYFVFEICVPWLSKLQESHETGDFTHLVHIVCMFIPVLDGDSVTSLLGKLFDNCSDLKAEYVLFQKLFTISQTSGPVHEWIESSKFGEKLITMVTSICHQDMDTGNQTDRDSLLDILKLVLETRKHEKELLIDTCYIENLLELFVKLLETVTDNSTAEQIENAVQFVAGAAQTFFTSCDMCLQLVPGKDLLLALFTVSLSNKWQLTEIQLDMIQCVWLDGVSCVVEQTGGLLYDTSILGRVVTIVQDTVTAQLTSLHMLSTITLCIEKLLSVVRDKLPADEGTNPVYTTLCQQLMAPVSLIVPHKVWEYLCVKGENPCIGRSTGTSTFPSPALYVSLYNCQLLRLTQQLPQSGGVSDVAMTTSEASNDWSTHKLSCLLNCIQGCSIVETFMEQNEVVDKVPSIGEACRQLRSSVSDHVHSLATQDRMDIWTLAFNRCESEAELSLCLPLLLTLLRSGQAEPLSLDLTMILDRSSIMSESNVRLLHSVIDYLSHSNQLTLSEIMVARLLSIPADSITQVDGGIGLLSVISHLVAMVTTDDSDVAAMWTGTLDQILSWKDANDDLFVYSSNLSSSSSACVLLNAEMSRYLCTMVQYHSHRLTDKHWDFIMCSLVSWIQSIEESQSDIQKSPIMQCFVVAICDLLVQVVVCITDKATVSSGVYPDNLVTEWTEFFSESIYTVILPFFIIVYKSTSNQSTSGCDRLLLSAVCNTVSYIPHPHIIQHKLSPLLVAGDLSPLPDSLQTLLNHICPLLLANERTVQVAAYWILNRIISDLPEYDKEDKSLLEAGATGGTEEETTNKSPPSYVMAILDKSSSVISDLLCNLSIDSCQPISTQDTQYHYAMAYLLSWKLLLNFFKSAPSELRQQYASYFQTHGHVGHLIFNIFRLMPNNPSKMFSYQAELNVKEPGSSTEIQHMACTMYQQVLTTMPAMVRNWWKEQDRKTSAYVDTFTTKHVSHLQCTIEIQTVQKTDVTLENMAIKARPSTREVIATYTLEEVSIEMVISLPQNYPLGNISVISEKRVGVSGPQWEKWLLQLNIFLQHQNGNIMEGLQIWKNNIDKRFEGVDECMICFYVLHGTNFQLPRITCRTCKKKYHSACLYKWFNTSHNCTCPLCRNVF